MAARALGLAAVLLAAACQGSAQQPACKTSADCALGTGVCRDEKCGPTPCGASMKCGVSEMCDAKGMCVPLQETARPCKTSTDCPAGSGVCRSGKCTRTPCSGGTACVGDELCAAGQCAPPAKGTPGRTFAAGGAVSTSGKHIHVGLTGQGRAVGPGESAAHRHMGGATSVMGR